MEHEISPLEQEALDFLEKMQCDYLERRDLSAVLAGLRPNTTWVGSGHREYCANFDQAKQALTQELEEYPGCFTIVESQFYAETLSECSCLVYGELVARPEVEEMADLTARISAVCIKTEQGMRLTHLHLSNPNNLQETGSYYVRREAAAEREMLQAQAKQAVHQLQVQGNELAALIINIPGGISQCRYDAGHSLIHMTNGFLELVGYTREQVQTQFQNQFVNMIFPEDLQRVQQTIEEQLTQGDSFKVEYRLCRGDGALICLLETGKRGVMSTGEEMLYCMLLDVTAQRKEQEQMRLLLERHQIIMDQATDIIFEWDIGANALSFSQNWRKKFGYDAISENISNRIPFSDNIFPEDMPSFVKLMEDTAQGAPYSEAEFRIRNAQGEFTWCRIRATTQYNSAGRAIKAVGVIVDIDQDKKQREHLLQQAQRDGLTELLNKIASQQALGEILQREQDGRGVLLLLDLDGFKGINDCYGHLVGDAVLIDTAATLTRVMRASDVVARIGGDEFLVYLPGAGAEIARRKAEEILQSLGKISIFGRLGLVSGSIGAAVFGPENRDYITLYANADRALYQVKNAGKQGVAFYSSDTCVESAEDGVVRSAVNSVIDTQDNMLNTILGDYSFRMLYRAIEPVVAVNQILELVGRNFDVSRVYIFESSEDGRRCSNTFEWCNVGISAELDNLQQLDYETDLGGYISNFNSAGVFYCKDIHELHPDLYKVLAPQGICSMLQCAIMDDGQFKGYVGFDECRENRHWTREQVETLTMVSNVLATFLMKLRLKEQLVRANHDNQPPPSSFDPSV